MTQDPLPRSVGGDKEDEEEANNIYSDTESDASNNDGHETKERKKKKSKPSTHAFHTDYLQDMQLYQALSPVFLKQQSRRRKGVQVSTIIQSISLMCFHGKAPRIKWRTFPFIPPLQKCGAVSLIRTTKHLCKTYLSLSTPDIPSARRKKNK
jgi:hypothetical protein